MRQIDSPAVPGMLAGGAAPELGAAGPEVAPILERALNGAEISVEEGTRLFEATGKELAPHTYEYNDCDVMLYALGIGATTEELAFVFEKNLQVLPTFAVVPAFPALMSIGRVLEFNPMMLLHGEQRIELRAPIPASGKLTVVLRGHGMPNGIVFSPDERRLYVSHTDRLGVVRVFDVRDDHTLSEPLLELAVRSDGMCIDTGGNLYTTSAGGIHVFDKEGKKLGVIKTPEQPANVCFGGENYDTLFITARKSLYSVKTKATGAKPKGAKW